MDHNDIIIILIELELYLFYSSKVATCRVYCCLSLKTVAPVDRLEKKANNNYYIHAQQGIKPINSRTLSDLISDLPSKERLIEGYCFYYSLRKQLPFHDATTISPEKWHLRNEHRNSILMTCHYPDLASASDWLKQISQAARPIKSTTQIWKWIWKWEVFTFSVTATMFSSTKCK